MAVACYSSSLPHILLYIKDSQQNDCYVQYRYIRIIILDISNSTLKHSQTIPKSNVIPFNIELLHLNNKPLIATQQY